jgi:hypothetical protein
MNLMTSKGDNGAVRNLRDGEKFEPDPPVRMMKVSIEVDGEFITTEVPTTHSVRAQFSDAGAGHLRGITALLQG